ncbi:HlyD family efflux transporter periplasmic adaptor subunit [Paenibacillus sp. GYB003]|uniref:HlyD family efflux transporter periplasmic adaptor subunit n=1 Tax=Paenibacillus sp. GYB003 TaxID=2994392 RepID=UPI002F96CB55
MKRTMKWTIVAAVAVALGGGGTYWFAKSDRPTTAAQSAEQTAKVQRGNIRLSVSGTSQFSTQNLQNITAPADGTIKTMNLTRSQPVKKDDILVEISNSSLEAALKDAQTALETQQQELNDLLKQKQGLRIVAPASGKLAIANLDVGSSVNKSAKLGTVSVIAKLLAKLPFPLEEAAGFKAGDEVDLSIAGFALTKTGRVQSVGQTVKADASGNRLVDVTVEVDNDGTLAADMEASGTMIAGGREIKAKGTAKLEAVQTAVLLSETSGTIAEMKKKDGDIVQAGELIAVVANDTLDESIASKQASIERQLRTVESAQQKVDDLTIKAPFDGVFSTDFANQKANVLANFPVGASVTAGSLFGAVASLDVMTLPIQIDELDLTSIKPGLKAEVTVDAIAGKTFQGEVLQVSTVGTTTNGVTYYDAIIAVDNKDQQLKYGMTGTAQILIQDKQNVLTVPIEAIRRQRGSTTVTVKRPDGSTEENVPIQIGIQSKTAVEVTGGLNEGDVVVLPKSRTTGTNQQQQQMMQGGFPGGGMPGGGMPGGGMPGGGAGVGGGGGGGGR